MSKPYRYFIATSPEYMVYSGNSYGWAPEPPEYGVDVCLVEAYNKRDAKIQALKHFLKKGNNYYRDCCIGHHVPYKHIQLEEIDLQEYQMQAAEFDSDIWNDWGSDFVWRNDENIPS